MSYDYDDDVTWGASDRAATALQAYYDEVSPDGDTYGDEGSEAFGDAFVGLLTDLMHLADRSGMDLDAMMQEAQAKWRKERQ